VFRDHYKLREFSLAIAFLTGFGDTRGPFHVNSPAFNPSIL
jgi:hypothetical protein